MLESELFAFLEHTSDAAYTVSESGEICSWNRAAEQLFGYKAADVLSRNVEDVLKARDDLGTSALAGGTEAMTRSWAESTGGLANFDLEVQTQSSARIWVNVSTIVFDNHRTGRRLFVRMARDVDQRHRNEELLSRMIEGARQLVSLAEHASSHAPVTPLSDQERRILTLFAEGSDPATIARTLSISSQTLRNHLHHINRKLRTHNRLEAVTHALRRGLLD
jgi:PAS domain S-box-containing protein